MLNSLAHDSSRTTTASQAAPADDALVAAAYHDRAAFADLYRRYVTRIYRYLLVRCGNEQDAQDLTAQTFLAALEGLTSYRGGNRFAAWLLGIARRKAADHFRGRPADVALDDAHQHAHPDPPPEDVIEQQLQVGRVVRALRALAPDRAEAVALHIFGDLSYAEVGQALGRSADAAKMLVHRGLRDLRARLNPDEEDDPDA